MLFSLMQMTSVDTNNSLDEDIISIYDPLKCLKRTAVELEQSS